MWSFLGPSVDRFSLQYFKQVINELREIKVVDEHNKELVDDLLQSIVEIVAYGDRRDPAIFECFMENQVLAEFVRLLRIGNDSIIVAPLLQYLSIMIQNMNSEYAVYYCLSNGYVNSIIDHDYNFDARDLAAYYVSFLRAVSSKVNRDTLCLLVEVQGGVVVSFPLYTEALTFAQHGEKMIQTAVRALTLNIYHVSDDMVYQFVTTPPSSLYFSYLVHSMKEQCIHLDSVVHATGDISNNQRRKKLVLETDQIVDDLYYIKDIICVGESRLSKAVLLNVLNLLVFPILLPLFDLRQSDGSNLSAITSLYIVSRLLQIVNDKNVTTSVAAIILYPSMSSSVRDGDEANAGIFPSNHLDGMETLLHSGSESNGVQNSNTNSPRGHFREHTPPNSNFMNCLVDSNAPPERTGILAFILSDNCSLMLASMFLLLTLAENKVIEYLQQPLVTPTAAQHAPQVMDGNILVKFMPQMMNALLKVLASETISVVVKWHTGWFLRILLVLQGKMVDEHNIHLFNTSYEQSRDGLQKELDGCWYDSIGDTMQNEWENCKTALEEPFQSKDPFFLLEISVCQQITDSIGVTSSHAAWLRMVDSVKDRESLAGLPFQMQE